MELTLDYLIARILDAGASQGGRLDYHCFWCGEDDGRYGGTDQFRHLPDCLFVQLTLWQKAQEAQTTHG